MDSQALAGELAGIYFNTHTLKSWTMTLELKAGQETDNHQDPWQILCVIFYSDHHLGSLVEFVLCECWDETQVQYQNRISVLGYQLSVFRALSCLFTTFPILLVERHVSLQWALQIHGHYYCWFFSCFVVYICQYLWRIGPFENAIKNSHIKSLNVH